MTASGPTAPVLPSRDSSRVLPGGTTTTTPTSSRASIDGVTAADGVTGTWGGSSDGVGAGGDATAVDEGDGVTCTVSSSLSDSLSSTAGAGGELEGTVGAEDTEPLAAPGGRDRRGEEMREEESRE
jgi:hypothetical protein